MDQPIRQIRQAYCKQAQREKGFAPVVLIGIIAVLILVGFGGFLVFQEFQEKKMPFSEKTAQQGVAPPEHATGPIEPTLSPAQSMQPPRPQTHPKPIVVPTTNYNASTHTTQPTSITTPAPVTESRPIGRDPRFEKQSQRLYTYGINCSGENTYGTGNSFTIDPNNPNVIYVGIEGRGVYKSVDKGLTWKKIIKGLMAYPDSNNLSELCFPDIAAIYIDSANTQRLLMVISDITTAYVDWPYGETGGIWESLDGGESWRQMLNGEINVAGSGSLAIDPNNSQIMYYPVNPDPPTFMEAPIKTSLNKKSSVYKTVNGGKTWGEIDMPMLPGLQALVTKINPKNSNHLLFFTQSHDHIYGENSITEIFLHKQHGVLESFDAGKTWIALGDKLPAPHRALFDGDVSKNNFNHMIVRPFLFGPEFPPETTQQKSFYSIDGGKIFEQTPIYIWIGRYDPHDKGGNHLLGYAPWQGWVVESKDAGKTWLSINSPQEVSGYTVKISNFVWDPKEFNTVYMSGDYGNVWQSIDGGNTWKNILNFNKLPK